jgi:hypothetical protein
MSTSQAQTGGAGMPEVEGRMSISQAQTAGGGMPEVGAA